MPRPDVELSLAAGIAVVSLGAIENDGPYQKITTRIVPEAWSATIVWPPDVLEALRAARAARTGGDPTTIAATEHALTTAVMDMIDDPPYGRWLR